MVISDSSESNDASNKSIYGDVFSDESFRFFSNESVGKSMVVFDLTILFLLLIGPPMTLSLLSPIYRL